MAYYSALLSTIELLEDILHPHRFPNSFSDNLTPTFNCLHKRFSKLLDSLQDYSFKGRDADPLEARIRDASSDALDIIESQIPEHRHVALPGLDWEKELQKVGEEVVSIVEQITAIKQSQMIEHLFAATTLEEEEEEEEEEEQKQQPAPINISNAVIGFEEHVLAIKEKLCGSSSQLEVIPIVGMGGIGKTTLARHTFNDPLVVYAFDFHGWVTISQDYNVIRVLLDIVRSLDIVVGGQDKAIVGGHGLEMERKLKELIYKHLKGRKFLVVIDDVWSVEVWDDIKHILPNDGNGSRIVLTTRLMNLAEYVGSIDSLHQVPLLDADASWSLLQEKAFVKESCPHQLVNIGRHIARKCRGLPLSIVVIGGILSNDKRLRYWESVADNIGMMLSEDDEHVYNIMSLSYNHLPHHLKPCFLHVSSFPEDCRIKISMLIKLWAAEGFLKSNCQSQNLEEMGHYYIQDLVKRNLLIITEEKSDGNFKYLVMHDVLIEFCRCKGQTEYFFPRVREGRYEKHRVEDVERIVVDAVVPFQLWENDYDWYERSIDNDDELKQDRQVNLLRILHSVNECGLSESLSSIISNMFHLKCLIVDCYYIDDYLPISKFQNLETLIIDSSDSDYIITLPFEIWKLSWLKYIIVRRMELPHLPRDTPLRKLEYLHTLSRTDNLNLNNTVVEMIPNIKKLKLEYAWDKQGASKSSWSGYGLDKLVNMLHLENLSIRFYDLHQHDRLVRSGFALPQNLKKLALHGCGLPWEVMTIVGSLKCLQVLKLNRHAFVGEVWAPVEGQFPELKSLHMEALNLRRWSAESEHFSKLQRLEVFDCWKLKEIPLDIGEIGALELIRVERSKYAGDSARKIKEEQQELGNYGLQVIVRDSWGRYSSNGL